VSRRAMFIATTWVAVVGAMAGGAHAQAEERFVLSGVVFVEGGRGVAWLQEPTLTKNQVVTVRPGDSIGPYRLTKILEDQVELEGPAGKFSVPLAGVPGTATAAASQGQLPAPGVPQPRDVLPPHPALANPGAIVIPRGDPGRRFPVFGVPAAASHGSHPQTSVPQAASDSVEIPGTMEPPHVLPPHPALANPDAIVIPRGDPRRTFPTSTLFPGAQ